MMPEIYSRSTGMLQNQRKPRIAAINVTYQVLVLFRFFVFLSHFYLRASGQAVVSGVVPSPPRYVPSIFIALRVQHSH